MELLGRALVLPDYRDGLMSAADARYEAWEFGRAQAGAGVAGLVSVPTSGPRRVASPLPVRFRSRLIAESSAKALGEHLDAFLPDADLHRIARLRMAVGFSARVHLAGADASARCCMLTLTYRGGNEEWEPCHVSDLIRTLRKWLARRGVQFRYVWVAELQKRGTIHYHLALWLPAGVDIPMPDRCGWWPHGMTRIETARSAPAYLMKYLSKGGKASEHKLPGGARSYGVGGLGAAMRLARRWLGLPGFIKARADVAMSAAWRRAPGGGWADPDGVIWSSEFERVCIGGLWHLKRVVRHAAVVVAGVVFAPAGAFSAWGASWAG